MILPRDLPDWLCRCSALSRSLPGSGLPFGGGWAIARIVPITVLVFLLDQHRFLVIVSAHNGHVLSTGPGFVHFVLLGLVLWSMNVTLLALDKGLIVPGCAPTGGADPPAQVTP